MASSEKSSLLLIPDRPVGFIGYGAYVPRYRLPGSAVARVWRFSDSGSPVKEKAVAGLDEAGRGPLAGPVVAAAVILRGPVRGVNDSKLLSAKDRESLYGEIADRAYVGIGLSTPEEIDLLNILNATKLAMNRALDGLSVRPSYVIIDGKYLNLKIRGRCIVGGDRLSASIASASVMAKVFRDRLMNDLGNLFPE